MTATTLYTRLLELLPDQPIYTGTVQAVHGNGMATVEMPGGALARVRNPLDIGAGQGVYVQDGAIVGEAPALPYVLIEI